MPWADFRSPSLIGTNVAVSPQLGKTINSWGMISIPETAVATMYCGTGVRVITAAALLTCAGVFGDEPFRAAPPQWDFACVQQRAATLAAHPYRRPPDLPEPLRRLDYDRYRLISFEHEKAIWKDRRLPFWLECFHRGYLFRTQVALNLIEDGLVNRLAFDPQLFQYRGELQDLSVPPDVGFAGFRVLGKFASSNHPREIASFLGASYFRAVGDGQFYGTSARGLAVDMGLPKAEEFPEFIEFWIERPELDARQLRIWTLLDSPSVAGAYQFTLQPGKDTVWDVNARLFFRRPPEKIGWAPLSSMWIWGDGRVPPNDDPRPQVHDADGLLVWTSTGQWIWRPLAQQAYPSLSHYDLAGIRGFGLLQRDRRPADYRDDEAKYYLRPSVWIEPRQGWRAGAVELLELPTQQEGVDNIAAWWTPSEAVRCDQPVDLQYTVAFLSGEPQQHVVGRAAKTRVVRREGAPIQIEIEFSGGQLAAVRDDAAIVPEVECLRGTVGHPQCQRQNDGTWRVRFDVFPSGSAPVELRAVLKARGAALSELWRYLCPT